MLSKQLVVLPSLPRYMLDRTSPKVARKMCHLNMQKAFASSAQMVQDPSPYEQLVKTKICTMSLHNASPTFAANGIVRSKDLSKKAEFLYHLEIVAAK